MSAIVWSERGIKQRETKLPRKKEKDQVGAPHSLRAPSFRWSCLPLGCVHLFSIHHCSFFPALMRKVTILTWRFSLSCECQKPIRCWYWGWCPCYLWSVCIPQSCIPCGWLAVMSWTNGIRLDRTMVRSFQQKVRSIHWKVRSLHLKSFFATNISYFAPCCNVQYYLAMIFKDHRWWCVLRRFEYIVFTLSFRLATHIYI